MKRMRSLRMLLALLTVIALAVGCGTAKTPTTPTTGATGTPSKFPPEIVLGAVDILTGPSSAYGVMAKKAHELAIEEINAAGGVKGSKLKIIFEDEAAKPDQAVQAMTKLITLDKVALIFGAQYTPSTQAILPVIDRYKMPTLSPTTSAAHITQLGNRWFFRTSPPSNREVEAIITHVVQDLGEKSFGMMAQNNDLGKTGVKDVEEIAKKLGAEIKLIEYANVGDKDYSGQISKFRALNLTHIVSWMQYQDTALFAKQSLEKGHRVKVYGGTLISSPKMMELGGEAVEGARFATSFNVSDPKGAVAQRFVKAYQAKYNELPDNQAAQAYDATYIAAKVIEAAGSLDGEAIRKAMTELAGFDGVMGEGMKFLPSGDLNYKMTIAEVKSGKHVTVAK